MGRQVAREVLDLLRELQRERQAPVGQVEAFGFGDLRQAPIAARSPARLGEPARHVLRQP